MQEAIVNDLLQEMQYGETNNEVKPAAKTKVLVVDDEEIMREFLADVLKDEGYDVTTASSGIMALELIEKETVEVMITDLMMPGMSGLEMLAQAKEMDPSLDIIVMTGYASVESAVESMKAGASEINS